MSFIVFFSTISFMVIFHIFFCYRILIGTKTRKSHSTHLLSLNYDAFFSLTSHIIRISLYLTNHTCQDESSVHPFMTSTNEKN